jgi:hypothetical protein
MSRIMLSKSPPVDLPFRPTGWQARGWYPLKVRVLGLVRWLDVHTTMWRYMAAEWLRDFGRRLMAASAELGPSLARACDEMADGVARAWREVADGAARARDRFQHPDKPDADAREAAPAGREHTTAC